MKQGSMTNREKRKFRKRRFRENVLQKIRNIQGKGGKRTRSMKPTRLFRTGG